MNTASAILRAVRVLAFASILLVPIAVLAEQKTAIADKPSQPAPATGSGKWEGLVQKKLQGFSPMPGAIICIGSSQMERWKSIQTDLAPLTVYNLGIGGSTMKQAADLFVPRLVIPFKPRAVILYEGSNDIASGETSEQILARFQSVHRQIHGALPDARLYVLGIVPSPGERFKRWNIIQQTNEALKTECATQPWMTYLDTTTPLIGADGQPRPECFIPGDIHMLPEGYKAWTSVIAPVVVEAEKKFEAKSGATN